MAKTDILENEEKREQLRKGLKKALLDSIALSILNALKWAFENARWELINVLKKGGDNDGLS